MGDVDTEPRDPAVEPEPQYLVHLVPDIVAPPIEVGLRIQEVVQVVLARGLVELPCITAESASPVVRWRPIRLRVRPHVVVAGSRVRRGDRGREPFMLRAGVIGDEIEQDPYPAPARVGDQSIEVLHRAQIGMDALVIGDVVTPIGVRRWHRRVQPEAVDAQPLEVVELLGDTAEIAHPVTVGVLEGPRVDLIEDALPPPARVIHARTSSPRYSSSEPERATPPSHDALGFGCRSWVVRSTAINPNLGPYPCDHSKLSSADQ